MSNQYADWLHAAIDEINKDQRTRGKRYSQYKLAQEAGVSQPALSRILSGDTTNPGAATYKGLVTALDQRLQLAYPEGHSVGEPPCLGNFIERRTTGDSTLATVEADKAAAAMDMLDEEVPDWHKSPHRGKLFTRYYANS